MTAPSGREPLCGGKAKASLLEGGGAALAVTEGVGQQSLEKLELMKKALMQEYFG